MTAYRSVKAGPERAPVSYTFGLALWCAADVQPRRHDERFSASPAVLHQKLVLHWP
jgi:hypothetical protein